MTNKKIILHQISRLNRLVDSEQKDMCKLGRLRSIRSEYLRALSCPSWLSGKYKWKDTEVEINTSLPYVSVTTYDNEYFFQGQEAEDVIDAINTFYILNQGTQMAAIKKYINTYL